MNTTSNPANSSAANFTVGGRPVTPANPLGEVNPASVMPLGIISPERANLENQIADLEAQLQTRRQEAQRVAEQEAAAMVAKRQEVIASIPGLLGVGSINEAMALLRASTKGAVISSKAKGNRTPPETLALLKLALEANTTITEASKRFKLSPATISNWKSKWGLTFKGFGGGGLRKVPNHRRRKVKLAA